MTANGRKPATFVILPLARRDTYRRVAVL